MGVLVLEVNMQFLLLGLIFFSYLLHSSQGNAIDKRFFNELNFKDSEYSPEKNDPEVIHETLKLAGLFGKRDHMDSGFERFGRDHMDSGFERFGRDQDPLQLAGLIGKRDHMDSGFSRFGRDQAPIQLPGIFGKRDHMDSGFSRFGRDQEPIQLPGIFGKRDHMDSGFSRFGRNQVKK